MVSFPFAASEYDRAASTLWFESENSLLSAYSRWLEAVDREETETVRSTRVTVNGVRDVVQAPLHTQVSGTLASVDVVNGDYSSIIDAMDAAAMADAAAIEAMLLQQYRSVTAGTGNFLDAADGELTHDLIRELVEWTLTSAQGVTPCSSSS